MKYLVLHSGARRDDPYSNGIGSMSMMPDGLQQVAQDLTNKMNAMQIANNLKYVRFSSSKFLSGLTCA